MPGIRQGVTSRNSDTNISPSGAAGRRGVDNRSKYAELMGQDADGRWKYRRIGPAALDWNHATEDRWNPYLATTKKPAEPASAPGVTSDATEDATRVYLQHRTRDNDPWPFGSLNDVFLVPCNVHDGGKDQDGNPIRRLMVGIDKAEFYSTDQMHGALAHIGPESKPPQYFIEANVEMYYHRPSHRWRWKTWLLSGRAPKPNPKTPGSDPPPPTPYPNPNPGTQPTGGGRTQPTGGGSTPSDPADFPNFPIPAGEPDPFGGVDTGLPDFGSPFGAPISRRIGEFSVLPSRNDGNGAAYNYNTGGSSANVFTGLYGPRAERASRGWIGTPLFDDGVEYLPARPKRGWRGTTTIDDPGELATAAIDWTDNTNSSFTQSQYDSIHETTERKEVMDAINVLDAKTTDLDSRARGSIMDCATVTVPAGSVTVNASTTYAVTGDAPKIVATSASGGFNVNYENVSGSEGTAYTADLRISDAAPAGGVEVSVIFQYAVATATAVS